MTFNRLSLNVGSIGESGIHRPRLIAVLAMLAALFLLAACAGVGADSEEQDRDATQRRILERLQRKTWSDLSDTIPAESVTPELVEADSFDDEPIEDDFDFDRYEDWADDTYDAEPESIADDSAPIPADPVLIAADPVLIAADSAPIPADPVLIAADPVLIAADPVLIAADPVLIAADPVLIAADPVLIAADPVLIAADPVLIAADPVPTTVDADEVTAEADPIGAAVLTSVEADPSEWQVDDPPPDVWSYGTIEEWLRKGDDREVAATESTDGAPTASVFTGTTPRAVMATPLLVVADADDVRASEPDPAQHASRQETDCRTGVRIGDWPQVVSEEPNAPASAESTELTSTDAVIEEAIEEKQTEPALPSPEPTLVTADEPAAARTLPVAPLAEPPAPPILTVPLPVLAATDKTENATTVSEPFAAAVHESEREGATVEPPVAAAEKIERETITVQPPVAAAEKIERETITVQPPVAAAEKIERETITVQPPVAAAEKIERETITVQPPVAAVEEIERETITVQPAVAAVEEPVTDPAVAITSNDPKPTTNTTKPRDAKPSAATSFFKALAKSFAQNQPAAPTQPQDGDPSLGSATLTSTSATEPEMTEPLSGSILSPSSDTLPGGPAAEASSANGDPDAVLKTTIGDGLSMELRDVPLKDLIRAVAQQNGMNVIVPETLTERVSISLDGVDPRLALESILMSNGYRLVSDGSLHRVETISEEEKRMMSQTFTLTSIPMDTIQDSLETILSENGKLIMNDDSPSFVMIDFPENIEAMQDYLRLIDRREKQVLIEVHILEVIMNDNEAIGSTLEILDISIDDATGAYIHDLAPDNSLAALGIAANKSPMQLIIEALAIHRKLNILSTPKLITLNGREAKIEVLASIPYIDSTATTSTTTEGGGSTIIQQVEFKESGIIVKVTPIIGNDGYVKMKIVPEVKELVDFFQGIPVIDSRKIDTNVLVKDGNTVILGGLLREEEMKETQKTPILGDIPLLGALFRRKETQIKKSELLVFITPTIINPDDESRLVEEANDKLAPRLRKQEEEKMRRQQQQAREQAEHERKLAKQRAEKERKQQKKKNKSRKKN